MTSGETIPSFTAGEFEELEERTIEWNATFRAQLLAVVRAAMKSETTPSPDLGKTEALLRRMVTAYDSDDSMEFLAALYHARRHLGLKLADEKEEEEDRAVLEANGLLEP